MRALTLLLAATLCSAAAAAPAGAASRDPLKRAGLVPVRAYAPAIELDIRYATRDNFTGRVLPGYCEPLAYLHRPAAKALARAQAALQRDGLSLRVFDAYRPARASRAMVRWAERSGNEWVLRNGYVARRSNHNRGAAVDLTLTRDGRALGMGTAYDAFTTRSHTLNARGTVLRNRLTLKRAMERAGFRNYRREWWHYDHPPSLSAPPLDLTLGC